METFDFPVHTVRHTYPEGTTIRFGGGYEYGVKPLLPLQRSFTLTFQSMQWARNEDGDIDETVVTEPAGCNLRKLDLFYEAHRMDKSFEYEHEIYGTIVVKFARPFECPPAKVGGSGWTEGFEMVLREQPF